MHFLITDSICRQTNLVIFIIAQSLPGPGEHGLCKFPFFSVRAILDLMNMRSTVLLEPIRSSSVSKLHNICNTKIESIAVC